MPLRIEESVERVVVRDIPVGMWVFGSVFVCSGLAVLSIPFASTAWLNFVLWERAAVIGIGAGHLLGGVFTTWSQVETRTTFNRGSGEGVHSVRHPFARRTTSTRFKLSEVRAIDVGTAKDSDGDPTYQLRMHLSNRRALMLQGQAIHGEQRAKSAALELQRALGLGD